MAWFTDQLVNSGDLTNAFTSVDIITVLVLSSILCYIVAKVYMHTHEGISYSHGYVQTILIFGVLVSMVMLIVGSNIARAFTLVGALSIVRFRNAIKDTRDLGFIFFTMVVGMAIGTRFYVLGIIMALFVCALIILMYKTGFATYKQNDEILKIVFPSGEKVEKNIEPILKNNSKHFQLINMDTIDNKLSELVYVVKFSKSFKDRAGLIRRIREINRDNPVYIYGTEHLIY